MDTVLDQILTVRSLTHAYNSEYVFRDIDLDVTRGELISIIGPSGAGKTTLLKIIAGIITPTSGSVACMAAGKSGIVLVFQDYILFPHMTVFNNVAFGLKSRKGMKKGEIRIRVMDILAYFGLEDKAKQYPANLSGGQKQRVALARALIVEPSLLLLDEPFANLDRNLKMSTASFLHESIHDFGSTAIMVTHDLHEASAVSDRMGLLLDGRLCQYDTVRNLYDSPATPEVAEFLRPEGTVYEDHHTGVTR